MPHAVSLSRAARLARSAKPFLARGGAKGERCPGCRLVLSHCLCALRPSVPTRAGVCLLMADIEPLKPRNTGCWMPPGQLQVDPEDAARQRLRGLALPRGIDAGD